MKNTMKKVTSEIVELFYEDGAPIGMLILNGSTNFYRVDKAKKDYVREVLLETSNNNEKES